MCDVAAELARNFIGESLLSLTVYYFKKMTAQKS